MPEICRFLGIVIRMFVEAGGQQQLPHFHAYYQEFVAVFTIQEIGMIEGNLPRRQQRFVEAWAELHQAELMADWDALQSGQAPRPVAPLQ